MRSITYDARIIPIIGMAMLSMVFLICCSGSGEHNQPGEQAQCVRHIQYDSLSSKFGRLQHNISGQSIILFEDTSQIWGAEFRTSMKNKGTGPVLVELDEDGMLKTITVGNDTTARIYKLDDQGILRVAVVQGTEIKIKDK